MASQYFGDQPIQGDQEDDCQGPHNWRKRLKPVQSPIHEEKEFCPRPRGMRSQGDGHEREERPPRVTVVRRRSSGERMDHAMIREKFKAKAILRKDSFGKTRGPMSPSVSPLIHKRRTPSSNESAFTRNVVNAHQGSPGIHRRGSARRERDPANPTRIPVPAGEIKKHSSAPNTPALGRKVVTPNVTEVTPGSMLAKKRVDKVLKARLYLLQQTGPNSFLIGGDSPDHKYRVIIGPQRCSCGRGPHCLHVLFVMLRVFQVPENNPCLWNKTLKNYEVESLFGKFHARRTMRIEELMKKKNRLSNPEPDRKSEEREMDAVSGLSHNNDNDDDSEGKEEEETCPICLLEMMEGESLVECENGCQNKLHHHCIAIWFEECRRQGEPPDCPLCRATWKTQDGSSEGNHGQAQAAPQVSELPVPPNTRASSPQALLTHGHAMPQELEGDMLLPHAEPIPPEHMETAQKWIPVLGEEVVSCLFSKNWVVREIALKQLSRTAVGALLLGVGEGRTGVVLSTSRQQTTHSMLECCCSVLAYICTDPVYKVFVAGLRTMRTVLSYTPCRDEHQQRRLQALMAPVIDTILLKCADSNKRTSQLSISAMQELVKGQEGELAVGREILHPGSRGLGGVKYLVSCITQDYTPDSAQWQWLLGRFFMLDKLIDEYPTDFIIRVQREELNDPDDDVDCPEDPREIYINRDHVFTVLRFAVPVMDHGHSKVAKMARRVFFMVSRLQAHLQTVFKQINDLLDVQQMNVQVHMKRKLLRVAEEYHLAQQMRGGHAEDPGEEGFGPVPPISASSTPRSSSPVAGAQALPHINVTVHNFVTGNLIIPSATPAPPNSPQGKGQRRRRGRSTSSTDQPNSQPAEGATKDHSSGAYKPGSVAGDYGSVLADQEFLVGDHGSELGDHGSVSGEHGSEAGDHSLTDDISEMSAPDTTSGLLTPPPTPHHRPHTLPLPVHQRLGSSDSGALDSGEPSDSEGASGPCSEYEDNVDNVLEAGDEQESFESQDEVALTADRASEMPPDGSESQEGKVRTLERKRKVVVADASVCTSPRLSLRGLNIVGWGELGELGHFLEQCTDPPGVIQPCALNAAATIHTGSTPETQHDCTAHPLAPDSQTQTATVTSGGRHSNHLGVWEAPVESEVTVSVGASAGSHGNQSENKGTRDVGTSPMPTEEVLTLPKVSRVKVHHTRSSSLPIAFSLSLGDAPRNNMANCAGVLSDGDVTPDTPDSDVTTHRLSIIKSEDEGLKSDDEGLVKSDDEGLKSYDDGLKSDDEGLRSDEDTLSSANATLNTTRDGLMSRDLSAITLSPSRSEDSLDKVTFKTEVATSPHRSPNSTGGANSADNCHCKEEVELEEAQALVAALERSTLSQEALPYVPGLCQEKSDGETMTIHIQDGHDSPDGVQHQQYQENVHWVRGHMLGTGAFSTCYQARDYKTGTLMAVKMISFCRNSLSEQEKVIEEVEEEIQMTAKLNNPNIVRILGATKQGCHFFMFTEWMPGGSVSLLLDMYGRFTEQVITSYTFQVLNGLTYLHENHVLHRDLKGANLLVDSTGQRVRIGDFGAAARLASRTTGAGEFQGQLLGTIAFMAPEVLRGETYGRSCDIWGVGCTIIEMYTTKPPWGAHDISNHLALIFRIASSSVPPPIPDGMSPALRDILLRCLETNRDERPPARELLKHPLFTMYSR